MNIEDRIAAMWAGCWHKRCTGAQETAAGPGHIGSRRGDSIIDGTIFDIKNNAVARIMDRSDLTDKGKLQSVVDLLSTKETDYDTAEKNFTQFEAYFTYAQSKRTQVSEQNIRRLMDELADGTKSTVKQILHDFNLVNDRTMSRIRPP